MLLQFQEFTFDAETRQLLRSGEVIHLTPKAFRLLEILLDSRPKAVSKETLIENLWPNTHVSEGNLTTLIAEIRRAFSERASTGELIRTVHRFGYAFCGDVKAAPSPGQSLPVAFQLVSPAGSFALMEGENWIGREGALISLDSPTVSRLHSRVTVRMGAATIEDLGSKNGTFVRGDRIRGPVLLADGDEIRIGAVTMIFRAFQGSETATFGG